MLISVHYRSTRENIEKNTDLMAALLKKLEGMYCFLEGLHCSGILISSIEVLQLIFVTIDIAALAERIIS